MKTTEDVLNEALALPVGARAKIASELLASLEAEKASPEVEAAWRDEVQERCRAYDVGEMKDREAADVFRDAYRRVQ